MPIAVVQEWSTGGSDTANYDKLHERITAADAMPDGFLVHTAGATPDGGFRIFEVWESEAQFRRFVEERLMPLLEELGAPDDPPTTTTYELRGFVAW
jgi:hypothetical protein